jgi:hypothetical protein
MGGVFSRNQQPEGEQQPLAPTATPNRNRSMNQAMTGTINNPNAQGVQDMNQNTIPDTMENSNNQLTANITQEGGKRRRATPAKRKSAAAPKKKTKSKAKPKTKPAQKKTSRSKSRA